MAKRTPVGSFNKDYLANVSKENFLTAHKHLEANGFTVKELTKVWESAQKKTDK